MRIVSSVEQNHGEVDSGCEGQWRQVGEVGMSVSHVFSLYVLQGRCWILKDDHAESPGKIFVVASVIAGPLHGLKVVCFDSSRDVGGRDVRALRKEAPLQHEWCRVGYRAERRRYLMLFKK